MYAGRVVETTSTLRLFANPRHPYTEALFAALPEKAVEGSTRLYNIPGQPPDLTAPPKGCKFAARCRYVTDTCRQEEPLLEGDTPDHEYRCFYPVGQVSDEAGVADLHVADRITLDQVAGSLNGDSYLLQTDHLVKSFAVTAGAVLQRKVGEVSAVADVSFGIRPGKTFGMVGESGCGKTTVGRLIVGLEKANSGSIVLDLPFGLRGGIPVRGVPFFPQALVMATEDGHPRSIAYTSRVPYPTIKAITRTRSTRR
jgi:peptide/nickel transport system ATP-binding protein